MRFGRALSDLWQCGRGYLAEGREWMEKLLALDEAVSRETRLAALHLTGWMAYVLNDGPGAQAHFAEGLFLSRELKEQKWAACCFHGLASAALLVGDLESARTLQERSLALSQELQDEDGVAWSHETLGTVARLRGELGAAQAHFEESLQIFRWRGDRENVAHLLHNLARVLVLRGDEGRARDLCRESLALWREEEHLAGIASGLECLAAVATAQHQAERAARLLGAADALYERFGAARWPILLADYQGYVVAAHAALGEAAFAAAWAEGHGMTVQEAINLALAGGEISTA
jgi:tetratricopeptide (TPR) repeat protein